ncbi:MAG: putative ABC transporter ATP-binding/permease protein [Candidatus Celerinatantimonas neptuna]|nr:MAG: putative ABC transporter ATP-binding/permease protein [Candidatus Celerinatantimonas neptuna]
MKSDQKLTIPSLIKNQSSMLWLALGLGLISTISAVFLLAISGWFITAAGLAGVMGMTLTFNYFTPGAIIRLMAILRTSGRYFEQLTAHHHLLSLLKDLRLWVWQQLTHHKLPQHVKVGDLLQRIVSDVDLLNRWPLQVWMPRIYAWVASLIYLIIIYIFAPATLIPMASGLIINTLILPWLSFRFGHKLIWKLQLIGVYRRSRFMNLFGALVTLSIRGRWQGYAERLFYQDQCQFNIEYRMQIIAAATRHLMLAITALTIASSSLLAATQLENGTIHGSIFAGLIFALLGLNEVFSPLAMSFIGTAQAQVGIKRLNQLQPEEPITPPTHSGQDNRLQSIELSNTDIRKQNAVKGIHRLNLHLETGAKIWLKGPSGIGKTTLLDALANQLEPESGEICYNHQSLGLNDRLNYQSQIGYLPQTPYIFNQSIRNNLRLGLAQATDEQIYQVLKGVALDEWVNELPNGIDTLLGTQGNNISGGQARRLGLARVLLQTPDVMLLDEPFEGLDKQTIGIISQTLNSACRSSMLIIASHLSVPLLNDFTKLELSHE